MNTPDHENSWHAEHRLVDCWQTRRSSKSLRQKWPRQDGTLTTLLQASPIHCASTTSFKHNKKRSGGQSKTPGSVKLSSARLPSCATSFVLRLRLPLYVHQVNKTKTVAVFLCSCRVMVGCATWQPQTTCSQSDHKFQPTLPSRTNPTRLKHSSLNFSQRLKPEFPPTQADE